MPVAVNGGRGPPAAAADPCTEVDCNKEDKRATWSGSAAVVAAAAGGTG